MPTITKYFKINARASKVNHTNEICPKCGNGKIVRYYYESNPVSGNFAECDNEQCDHCMLAHIHDLKVKEAAKE